MGATTFDTQGKGNTEEEAFNAARENALYQYGHRGYTGTIAEKHDFVLIQKEPLTLEEAQDLADDLISDGDERIENKWGPAGAIPLLDAAGNPDGYLFFGWASE